LNNVAAGNSVLCCCEFRVAQVSEAKLVEGRRPKYVRVAERECLIADGTRFSVSGKCSWVELVAIIKTITTEDSIFGAHHLVDPEVELIKVIGAGTAIEIVKPRVSVRPKAAGRVGQRIETG